MKKLVCTISLLLTALLIVGCGNSQESTEAKEAEITYLAGWIVISGGRLYLSEAQVYVVGGDEDPFLRYEGENFIVATAEEFDQLDIDMPSVWKAVPLGNNVTSFRLTDETVFTFMDTSFFFTQDITPRYYTTNAEEFLMHLHFQSNGLFNVYRGGHRLNCLYDSSILLTPKEFFLRTCRCAYIRHPIVIIQVQDDRVISVIEEFMFTQ